MSWLPLRQVDGLTLDGIHRGAESKGFEIASKDYFSFSILGWHCELLNFAISLAGLHFVCRPSPLNNKYSYRVVAKRVCIT